MATLFDVICEQHEKKEAFKNKIVEKRLQKKNLKRVVNYNVKHTTYFNKEEYILYSLPIVTNFESKTKRKSMNMRLQMIGVVVGSSLSLLTLNKLIVLIMKNVIIVFISF